MWKETAVTEPPGPYAPPAAQPITENELRTILAPSKALKVFAMILFDVIAEIRHDRKYRKEFEEQSPPLPAPSVSGSNRTPQSCSRH
jgi:hypothetical protein